MFKRFQNPLFVSWLYDIVPLARGGGLFKLLKYFLFDVVLMTADVVTDILTFIEFLNNGNTKWAYTNLSFIFLPSVIRLVTTTYEQSKGNLEIKIKKNEKVKEVMLASIKALPIIQTIFSIRRFFVLKDQLLHTSDPSQLNKTYRESAQLKVFEAFAEAGPSQVLNVYIFLVTGCLTWTQGLSITTGFLSLSMSSLTVYYLFRSKKEEDPNPSIPLLLMPLLPMIVNTVASTLLWAIVASFGSILIVPSIFLVFVSTYTSLLFKNRFIAEPEDTEINYSRYEVALLNTFQPVAVGNHSNTLAISAVASYGARLVLILLLWIFQAYRLHTNTEFSSTAPLLTCVPEDFFRTYQAKTNLSNTCTTLGNCFYGIESASERIRYRMFAKNFQYFATFPWSAPGCYWPYKKMAGH